MKQLVDAVDPRLGLHALDLSGDFLIVGDVRNLTDDSEGHREVRPLHVGEHHLEAQIVGMAIVSEDVILSDSVFSYSHHLQPPTIEGDSFVSVLSEYHLLAVTQNQRPVGLVLPVGNLGVRAVVEYHAVSQELHHGSTLMP